MNIALFGGSFDPPHFGHKKIVEEALKVLDIDKLIVMPTYLNPFKTRSHFEAQTRIQMVKELLKKFESVTISDFEVKHNRKVSTIETVNYLYTHYDIQNLYLIIGADNLEKLHLWDSYEQLEQKVQFVIASRDKITIDPKYKTLQINCDISSTKIRKDLDTIKQKEKKV